MITIIINIEKIEIHLIHPDALDAPESGQGGHTAVCPDCGWTRDYSTKARQKRGLAAHQAHCPGPHVEQERLRRMMGFEGAEE